MITFHEFRPAGDLVTFRRYFPVWVGLAWTWGLGRRRPVGVYVRILEDTFGVAKG